MWRTSQPIVSLNERFPSHFHAAGKNGIHFADISPNGIRRPIFNSYLLRNTLQLFSQVFFQFEFLTTHNSPESVGIVH